ncbi:inhibitor of vertebrate lysozyme family protein [Pseudomonas aeruginosa]|uniref:inhibitor of vertebrate lysozyme family protein n=1 Tax=Pseudomonas aeruginosa TaxID=287 RepID=UPI00046769F6|nr:inhibitor of vertebrate lysozyme family protein [Pseudomonas aeruginosa]EIU1680648.1 inhibitor of vertebrate lysozyme family protein [Pseudomonas aeruginosa]EKV4569832.1 inhibitor of vertebrate lysozyme family protein [Pseudomonas aeruginosa]KSD37599.1 hypothetical protein AO902_09695 [Pseudomonas aeruginosa]MBH8872608.1 inhibitor of vertebrate lysozyme family protein [Pseudomonas aeruginosa]MBI8968356.1 inhibitor of vertebrate lysozyme family protein [Pseudomonas aeruginosa]
MRLMRNLMNALLLGAAASSLAVAADRDGEYRLNELQSTDAGYRKAWQNLVEDESRLPEWVMNLSGTATPMHAVDDQGDKYLVGGLCEKSDCKGQRLLVAFDWDKSHAYGLYVQVPEGLPQDKSPSKHASFRWLGKPEPAVQKILDEQLKADPNWY